MRQRSPTSTVRSAGRPAGPAGRTAPSREAGVPASPAAAARRVIGVASRGILKIPGLADFLDAQPELVSRWNSARFDTIAGWGRKPTSRTARLLAEQNGVPFLTLEDGFLRSVGRGDQDPPMSIVVDDLGIYYDATAPSRLEVMIPAPLDEAQTVRARALIAGWRRARISKYNHARDPSTPLPERFVLVADQTYGDDSIRCGLADPGSFQLALRMALEENPEATVVVKTHPDVWAGRKRGHFDLHALSFTDRVRVMGEDCHPALLLERAEAVYAVTSQLGFEALLWGRPVRCFGMPFYAGWGLTQDEQAPPERRGRASLEQLVHAALVRYPRYRDGERGRRCEVEAVLSHLALQRRMAARFPRDVFAVGFSAWKRRAIRQFLAGSEVHFSRSTHGIPDNATVAIWGDRGGSLPAAGTLIRVEDGFLRSIGLGADMERPLSLALDPVGMYYDPREASALERILSKHPFDDRLVERAGRLRERIVSERLTKYNLADQAWSRPDTDKQVVLVPGQVERDASIRYGSPRIKTNIHLLRAVRTALPKAHIVYKPHPDVVAGLRDPGNDESHAHREADEVVTEGSVIAMLDKIDELHTMTSLAGFEAVIRGKPVTCYGQPFYCGWGLTTDRLPAARRGRRLSVDALVAGCLILYPTYVSRTTGHFLTPEQAVDALVAWRETSTGTPYLRRKALRLERWVLSGLRTIRRG